MPLRVNVVTLFPEVFVPFLGASIPGRAAAAGLVEFRLVQLRDFTHDRHQTVDDYPYGGGAGIGVARSRVLGRPSPYREDKCGSHCNDDQNQREVPQFASPVHDLRSASVCERTPANGVGVSCCAK